MWMINDKLLLCLYPTPHLHLGVGGFKQVGHDKCYSNSPVFIYYQTKASQPPLSVSVPQRHSPRKTSFISFPIFIFNTKLLKGTQEMGVLGCLPTCLHRGGAWTRPRVAPEGAFPRGGCQVSASLALCYSSSPFPARPAEGWGLRAQHRCAFHLSFPFSRNSQSKRGVPRKRFLTADDPGQLVKKKKKKKVP